VFCVSLKGFTLYLHQALGFLPLGFLLLGFLLLGFLLLGFLLLGFSSEVL